MCTKKVDDRLVFWNKTAITKPRQFIPTAVYSFCNDTYTLLSGLFSSWDVERTFSHLVSTRRQAYTESNLAGTHNDGVGRSNRLSALSHT